jgi:hypothetical protein
MRVEAAKISQASTVYGFFIFPLAPNVFIIKKICPDKRNAG